MKITRGKQVRPQKVVIYGVEGIGKSTLAAQFPDPVFIDVEGGTAQLDIARINPDENDPDKPWNWKLFMDTLKEVAKTKDLCKSIVIDTADWAEKLCISYILKRDGKRSIESYGYGKGYTVLKEEFQKFLDVCDSIITSGKNVVITAHAIMRKQELPDEAGAFDRWEMKLSKQVSPLLREWSDTLLFLNYQTKTIQDGDGKFAKTKASGERRVIYTTHTAILDAKNRYGLPPVVGLDYKNISKIFDKPIQQKEVNVAEEEETDEMASVRNEIIQLCKDLGGTKNTQLMDTLKVYTPTGNPNSIKSIDMLNKCLEALKTIESV